MPGVSALMSHRAGNFRGQTVDFLSCFPRCEGIPSLQPLRAAGLRYLLPEPTRGSKFPLSEFPASSSPWGQTALVSLATSLSLEPWGLTRGAGTGFGGCSGVTPRPAHGIPRGSFGFSQRCSRPSTCRLARRGHQSHPAWAQALERCWVPCPGTTALSSLQHFPTSRGELEVWTLTQEGDSR